MIRSLLSITFFLFFFLIETSFLTALPFVFPLIPLTFALGVYLLQQQGLIDGFFWIIAYGFLLQILHMDLYPFPIVSFSLAAVVCLLTARRLFSNRSLYGVLACALLGYLTLMMTQSFFILVRSISHSSYISWSEFFVRYGLRTLLLFISLYLLFSFAKPIQIFLFRQSPALK